MLLEIEFLLVHVENNIENNDSDSESPECELVRVFLDLDFHVIGFWMIKKWVI